jgi:hypothetical protein
MSIVILAWGSLVWDSRDLPMASAWQLNGPKLPIEFSRVSKDARLTLVIDPVDGVEVPTRFARSKRLFLLDAVADLRDREGTIFQNIGFTDRTGQHASYREHTAHEPTHQRLLHWLGGTDFDAVVWTALPSNYLNQQRHKFTVAHAASYLQALPAVARDNALDYIRKAPPEVLTPLRQYLSEKGVL